MASQRLQLFDVWQRRLAIAGHYPRQETFFNSLFLCIRPSFQSVIDFALTIVLLVIPIEFLPPGFFLLYISGSYFAEVGQDLECDGSARERVVINKAVSPSSN